VRPARFPLWRAPCDVGLPARHPQGRAGRRRQ